MSESTISILIAAGILLVLALFIPCMESLARRLRRSPRERNPSAKPHTETQSVTQTEPRKRHVA